MPQPRSSRPRIATWGLPLGVLTKFDEVALSGTWDPSKVPRDVEAVVFAQAAFKNGPEVLDAVSRCPRPALLLGDAITLEAALDELGAHADVCLQNAPPRLIERRIGQLIARAGAVADRLTGAMARSRFLPLLEERLEGASAQSPVSLILFDLDRFKHLNDELGHTAGDSILRQFSLRIQAALGPDDLFARMGGEEFGVCTERPEDAAEALAARLLGLCRGTPFDLEDSSPSPPVPGPTVTVSAGIASATAPVAIGELLQHVDEALYAAKAQGRDRCVRSSVLDVGDEREEAAFEHMTKVLSDRVASIIARRGRRLFRELRQEADEDALTGLWGRRYLERRLPTDLEQARSEHRPFLFALLDVDHFGLVNKTHGWPTGDRVLREVARTARSLIDPVGWVARFVGEEFALVLPASSIEDARPLLDALLHAVRQQRVRATGGVEPGAVSEQANVAVTISIGVTCARADDDDESLLERASSRLLEAKNRGRDQLISDCDDDGTEVETEVGPEDDGSKA